MDRKMFWWFFGTIATIIVVAFLFAMVAPATHGLIFVAFLGLGGIAALWFAYYAYFSLKKDFQAAVDAAGVTIRQLEKRVKKVSSLHQLLAELPNFLADVEFETGGAVRGNSLKPTIVYGDAKNVVWLKFVNPTRFDLSFQEISGKVVAKTTYNEWDKTCYISCDKEVDGDIMAILQEGKGELTFLTGMDADDDRKEVKITFTRLEPAS